MKKLLLTFVLFVSSFSLFQINAVIVITDQYKFLFDGVWSSTIPSSPVITATTSTTATDSPFGVGTGSLGFNTANTKAQFSCSGASGARGGVIMNLNGGSVLSTSKKEIVEFDWDASTANGDAGQYLSIALSDASKNPIFVLTTERWSTSSSGLHLMNLNPAQLTSANLLVTPAYTTTGSYVTDWINLHSDTWLGTNFPNAKSYHIKAKLDFTTHIIDSIWITRLDDPTLVYIKSNIYFISSSANNGDRFGWVVTRGKNATNSGNGGTISVSNTIDNLHFYTWETVANVASVIVNYYDADDNTLITSLVRPNQPIGGTYSVTDLDKTSFILNGFNCVYSSTVIDNVEILANSTAHVDLKVKRYVITSGDYIWTGNINDIWNELNGNFTTDGTNSLGYQAGNAVTFPETALNKNVNVSQNFDIGTSNITVSGTNYSFAGIGVLTGSGKYIINPGIGNLTTLSIINNLLGGVELQSGTINVLSTTSGSSFTMFDGTQLNLNTDADFSKTITGTGSITIKTLANRSYGGTLTGASTVNLILGVSGSLASGTNWSSKVTNVMPSNALVNVTTDLSSAGYAIATNSLTNSKLNLGDNIRLMYNYNASTGGTTVTIGELSGSESSTIEGGWADYADRPLLIEVGSLNTDATFAGVIKKYGSTIIAPLKIYKKGNGIWTLTGNSTYSNVGSLFNVDAGKVIMNGSLSSENVPVTVASGATLAGTGTIGGPVTINGTLEGSLHFGSTLALAGTTNLTVTDIEAAQFDVLTVTGAVTNGGVLNINLLKEPTGSGTIKLIAAPDGAYSGTFTAVNINTPSAPSGVPAARRAKSAIGYSYDPLTGVLSYTDLGTGISELNNTAEIYPTLTRGEVYVNAENGATVDVLSLNGQLLKQLKTSGIRTTLNLKGLADGTYLVKVRYTDGTDKTQQVILRK